VCHRAGGIRGGLEAREASTRESPFFADESSALSIVDKVGTPATGVIPLAMCGVTGLSLPTAYLT